MVDGKSDEDAADVLIPKIRGLHTDLAILIATDDDGSETAARYEDDPCVGVIAKPYTLAQLRSALDSLGVRCNRG